MNLPPLIGSAGTESGRERTLLLRKDGRAHGHLMDQSERPSYHHLL